MLRLTHGPVSVSRQVLEILIQRILTVSVCALSWLQIVEIFYRQPPQACHISGVPGIVMSNKISHVLWSTYRPHNLQRALTCRFLNLRICQPVSVRMPLHRWNTACACRYSVDYLSCFGMVYLESTADTTSTSCTNFFTCSNQESSVPTPAQTSHTA